MNPATSIDRRSIRERKLDVLHADVPARRGMLIVNADDWGRNRETTDRTLECIHAGAVSAASAMVFMEDSERAAAVAKEQQIDVGLHLNLTTPFSAPRVPTLLADHQLRVTRHLRRHRLAHAVFHPGLMSSFDYVVQAQLEEFQRLYSAPPAKIDGHHHAHLCANVLLQGLLPSASIVRRNFSFDFGEKNFLNVSYRRLVDGRLGKHHKLTDLFFSLPPLEPSRLERIFLTAQQQVVELETHPVQVDEYAFLAGGEIFRWIEKNRLGSFRDFSSQLYQ